VHPPPPPHPNNQSIIPTPPPNAPQVLLGTDRGYTTAVDCYGFGVVVSEMLCRTVPFAGHDTNFMDISKRNTRPGLPDTSMELVRHCQLNKGVWWAMGMGTGVGLG
jgi:hypothetical protein